ncbi:hypothetical protein [Gulosibacter chungangensis]|uniref:hypothetical protein n=1 Tax=Gulosibacter chungangensis TaxID=979746 RepID=UPI001CE41F3C|nr:hypothetical protein [Gulosibacter chungangensis]
MNPAQYAPERIVADDVQTLMKKITIVPSDEYSARFPDEMPAFLEVELADGKVLSSERNSYEGFHDDPLSWEGARRKFDALTTPFADLDLREQIAAIVNDLENRDVAELTEVLARVSLTRCEVQPALA